MRNTAPDTPTTYHSTLNNQPMSGVFPPMPLDCTICTVILGNGAAIGVTKTITAHQLTKVPGKPQIITEWGVGATGAAWRAFAAVTIAAYSRRMLGGCTGVFA